VAGVTVQVDDLADRLAEEFADLLVRAPRSASPGPLRHSTDTRSPIADD
jgi:hypothetical protein